MTKEFNKNGEKHYNQINQFLNGVYQYAICRLNLFDDINPKDDREIELKHKITQYTFDCLRNTYLHKYIAQYVVSRFHFLCGPIYEDIEAPLLDKLFKEGDPKKIYEHYHSLTPRVFDRIFSHIHPDSCLPSVDDIERSKHFKVRALKRIMDEFTDNYITQYLKIINDFGTSNKDLFPKNLYELGVKYFLGEKSFFSAFILQLEDEKVISKKSSATLLHYFSEKKHELYNKTLEMKPHGLRVLGQQNNVQSTNFALFKNKESNCQHDEFVCLVEHRL